MPGDSDRVAEVEGGDTGDALTQLEPQKQWKTPSLTWPALLGSPCLDESHWVKLVDHAPPASTGTFQDFLGGMVKKLRRSENLTVLRH